MCSYPSQDEVRGSLSDNIPNYPGDDDVVVLILVQVEIFFHARDEGVGYV